MKIDWMTCSSDASTTEGVSHTQYRVLYCSNDTSTIKEMYPHGHSYIGINLHQPYSFSHNNGSC